MGRNERGELCLGETRQRGAQHERNQREPSEQSTLHRSTLHRRYRLLTSAQHLAPNACH